MKHCVIGQGRSMSDNIQEHVLSYRSQASQNFIRRFIELIIFTRYDKELIMDMFTLF